MLLICPVRPGDVNEELRYALRSWETNLHLDPLGSVDTLMTVGYKPSWLRPDLHVEGNRFKSMPLAVFDNVLIGAATAVREGWIEAVYMNDDFFCLDPVGSILPVKRNMTLEQHIGIAGDSSSLWWPRSLRLTASWLSDQGFPHPDSYEVHRPLFCDPQGMVDALSRWDMEGQETVPQWRTVYGVINEVEAYPVVDAKLGRQLTGYGTPWVSTSDQTWRVHGRQIKPRFQKPSRWEIG